MKVKELLRQLIDADPEMDVVIDVTRDDADILQVKTLTTVLDMSLEDGTKYVCLSGDQFDINEGFNFNINNN